MTTNITSAPTIDDIRAILHEAAGFSGTRYDHDADGLTFDGEILTPQAVHGAWASIRPNDNEGSIADEDTKVVFGAIMNEDGSNLWTDYEPRKAWLTDGHNPADEDGADDPSRWAIHITRGGDYEASQPITADIAAWLLDTDATENRVDEFGPDTYRAWSIPVHLAEDAVGG